MVKGIIRNYQPQKYERTRFENLGVLKLAPFDSSSEGEYNHGEDKAHEALDDDRENVVSVFFAVVILLEVLFYFDTVVDEGNVDS